MKRIIVVLLSFIMLTSLFGCAGEPEKPKLRDESMPLKLLKSDITDLPIGNNDMTCAQRRQLCLDFMNAQVTAQ